MKRIIVKKWDDMNGKLVARVYKIYRDTISLQEYHSPILMGNIENCRGKMSTYGIPFYFGRDFINEIGGIAKIKIE